jgi:hypothetical protein
MLRIRAQFQAILHADGMRKCANLRVEGLYRRSALSHCAGVTDVHGPPPQRPLVRKPQL